MKRHIKKLIEALDKKRGGLLDKYLEKVEAYAYTEPGPQPQGMDVIMYSGLIQDIDKHITILNLELKRIEALEVKTTPVEFVRA